MKRLLHLIKGHPLADIRLHFEGVAMRYECMSCKGSWFE